jgi:hypothetical protein
LPREAVLGNRRWDLLPRIAGDETYAGQAVPDALSSAVTGGA